MTYTAHTKEATPVLREKAGLDEPKPSDYLDDKEGEENFDIDTMIYHQHIECLRQIPIHPYYVDKFEDGKDYDESDVDVWTANTWGKYKEQWGCDNCCNGDRCDNPRHVSRKKCKFCKGTGFLASNKYAIPKQKEETQEQLWENVMNILKVYYRDDVIVKKLQSKFIITRR